jgi:hypothetical protein
LCGLAKRKKSSFMNRTLNIVFPSLNQNFWV